MKIFACFLILAACINAAFSYTQQKRKKISCLFEVCRALNILKGELATNLLPLPELYELTAARADGRCREFFSQLASSLSEIDNGDSASAWEKTAQLQLSFMGNEELKLFSSLGFILGKFQLNEQLSAIDSVIHELQTSLSREKSAFPAQKKLSFGLSTAGGLLILILLI